MRISRTIFALAVSVFATSAIAHESKTALPAEDCENAPADAVLTLPAPATYWMQIVCTESGHTLAPIPGDAWLIREDSRTFAVSAEDATDSYFVSVEMAPITQEQKIGAHDLFVRKTGEAVDAAFSEVVSLKLIGSRGRETTLYVFVGDEGPVAGMACVGDCEHSVAVTVIHPQIESVIE